MKSFRLDANSVETTREDGAKRYISADKPFLDEWERQGFPEDWQTSQRPLMFCNSGWKVNNPAADSASE